MSTKEFQQLHEKFKVLLSDFSDVYEKVTKEGDWKNPFRDVIAMDIPQLLTVCADIQAPYITVGSYGKGRWTAVPWIAVFDRRITTSAQKGVYIVYLLNKDSKELYLTFEIAATEVMGTKTDSKGNTLFTGVVGNNSPKVKKALRDRAVAVQNELQNDYFCVDENIHTGSSGYDNGAIYYKKYTLNDLPNGEELIADLKRMLSVYRDYYEKYYAIDEKWSPSLGEYNPNISKEKWLELLPDLAGPIWGGALAMFYTEKNGATCAALAKKFNMQPTEISGRCTNLAKSVQKKTNCSLYSKGVKDQYWFILFFRKDTEAGEKGNYIWKLRPELYDALTEFNILRFLPKSETDKGDEPEFTLTQKEAMAQIKNFIASRGFSYPGNLIENFYLSLKSKPFTILAGTSGTGKTRLVKLFAEAIGANEANGRYKMVSVRPDWSDGSDLFGHTDLSGKFINGAICSAFEAATKEPDKPVFLCLDEMNLARVEYYLSDFLSVIESREKGEEGRITTSAIAQYEGGIPDNLYIVGTVNMDETTFPFSKKVLDRANTIEFNYVELVPRFEQTADSVQPLQVPNSFLRTEYLVLERDCADERDYVVQICDKLQAVNEILRKANAHVGYRVRDEIVFYMLNNKKADNLLTEEQAFDNEIMQKILPRIQGSSVAIKDMLVELFKFCMGSQSGPDTDSGKAGEQMQSMAESAIYKESALKIGYMMKRYEEDGFTSYWL